MKMSKDGVFFQERKTQYEENCGRLHGREAPAGEQQKIMLYASNTLLTGARDLHQAILIQNCLHIISGARISTLERVFIRENRSAVVASVHQT